MSVRNRLVSAMLMVIPSLVTVPAAHGQLLQTFSFTNVTPQISTVAGGGTMLSATYTGPTGTLGRINLAGTMTEINGTTEDFINETQIRITYPNNSFIDLGAFGDNYVGTTPFSGFRYTNGFSGVPITNGTQFNFAFRNSTDDPPGGGVADNILNTINFEFRAETRPVFPATIGGSLTSVVAARDVQAFRFTITTAGTYTFNTEGTTGLITDTELGLYGSNGNLIVADDDSGTGDLSSITTVLTPGVYTLFVGANNTGFGLTNFEVNSSAAEFGSINVNGLTAVVPEPVGLSLVAVIGLAAARRRGRKGV